MLRLIPLILFSLMSLQAFAQDSNELTTPSITSLTAKLPDTKLRDMNTLIEQLVATEAPQVRKLLSTLLEGDLYFIRSNDQVVIAIKTESQYQLTDILTGTELASSSKSAIKKYVPIIGYVSKSVLL
ncbi:hypothetical protein ACLKMH_06930 [Psychromonas sp. KJ10-10]|uniref:hypothetical protein n=1 Tax=Psychromonas sp. KJ10-10 TaxID=3391823 RepID=UPI0039B60D04